ncbi:glycosyltransferase family 25 protein [Helicobacter sp. 23-1045]
MQNIEIFIINLARSVDRRESMKQKIAKIRGFGEIYIDGEKITHPLTPSAREGEQNAESATTSSLRENERSEFSWQSKTRESSKNSADSANETKNAESCTKSQNLNLDDCFASLTNPMDCHDSASQNLAMTESNTDSANQTNIAESNANCHFERSEKTQKNRDSSLRTSRFAQNDKNNLPLPNVRGGLRGWVDSQNNSGAKFSNSDFTHPLAPSASEGESLDLHFHFFSATDANDFKDNPAKIPPHYHPKLTRFVKGKDLSFGEIACFSSHYRLWEKCVALDSPIVVLEDDIDFMQDFCQIADIFKSPFEYVRLYYLFDRKISQIYDNFYISFGKIAGTQGYYLTPTAAQKFIKNARFWLFCVDDYMDMFFIHNVKNIIFLPFVIAEDSINATQSTILGRTKPKMSFWRKLTRELSRIYFYVIRKWLYFALNCVEIRAFFSAKQNRK